MSTARTPDSHPDIRRVLVCGTKFGQVYLESFRCADSPFQLAGILARGSDRSRTCARFYDTPLYTDVDQIPDDVDAACVVVRSGLLGGEGADLAQALLRRGLHVLQEHPLHHDELAACLKTARRHGVVYRLNSFYVNLAPVRRYLAMVRALVRRQPVRYVDAACGFQVAYALLDILGQALGGFRPWGFVDIPPMPPRIAGLIDRDLPFRSIDGVLGGVPITLRVQNQLDPADPDNYAHLLHRVTVGTEGGALTLVGTHGPIVWSPRPDFPRQVRELDATPHFADTSTDGDHLAVPSGVVLADEPAPSYREVFEHVWPDGVQYAVSRLREDVRSGVDPLRHGQYHLGLCTLWQDLTSRLGPPELVAAEPPALLGPAQVKAIQDAADTEQVLA